MKYLQNRKNQKETCHFAPCIHYCIRSSRQRLKSTLRCTLGRVTRQMRSQQIGAACSVVLGCAGLGDDHALPNPVCTRSHLLSSDSQNQERSGEPRRSNPPFLCCSCDVFLMPLPALCALCCKHAHPKSLREDGCDALLPDRDVCLPCESLLIFPFHSPRVPIMIAEQNHCCPTRTGPNCPPPAPTHPSRGGRPVPGLSLGGQL